MNCYQVWCNLKDGSQDLEFCRNVTAYLDYLQKKGWVVRYRILRRKFGFGPPNLGDFQIIIESNDLNQLDQAFNRVAVRDDEIEKLHAPVYRMAKDLQTALYRDFPDSFREGAK